MHKTRVCVQGAIFGYYTFIVRMLIIIELMRTTSATLAACCVVCISNSYAVGNDVCVCKTDAHRNNKCNKLILIGARPRHSYDGMSAISSC